MNPWQHYKDGWDLTHKSGLKFSNPHHQRGKIRDFPISDGNFCYKKRLHEPLRSRRKKKGEMYMSSLLW